MIAQNVHPVGDGGKLLADVVVQIMADAALLAVADLQNLALQPFPFGDVPRDAFHLGLFADLFNQAGADFQTEALPFGIEEIPFHRWQFHTAGNCDGIIFGMRINADGTNDALYLHKLAVFVATGQLLLSADSFKKYS